MKPFNLLGVGVHPTTYSEVFHKMKQLLHDNKKGFFCFTPVYSIMQAYLNQEYRNILSQSTRTCPDGMGVVWGMRLLGQKEISNRVYGPDLMSYVLKNTESHWRHFLLGASEQTLQKLKENIQIHYPKAQIVGTYAPSFGFLKPSEVQEIEHQLVNSQAHIVWVGMGAPKQDFLAHQLSLSTKQIFLGVGAAFDFLAGHKKQAPKNWQKMGFEWLYRLIQEPQRLWKRYLVYNPYFLFLLFLQYFNLKKFQLNLNMLESKPE